MSAAAAAPAGSLLPAGGRAQDQERARLLAAALAPGAVDVTTLVWGGEPPTKSRPRFAEGRTYKAPQDEAAEQRTGWQFRRAFRQPWTGNLAVGLVFFRSDRRRIDVDNLVKHVLDAGNGIGWVDDAQITALYGVAELDTKFPRTLLVVTRHVSSLDRTPSGAPAAPRKRPSQAAGCLVTDEDIAQALDADDDVASPAPSRGRGGRAPSAASWEDAFHQHAVRGSRAAISTGPGRSPAGAPR